MNNLSVLILTLNEEVNLPGCLESVRWSDDIVVFDSCSTDRTVEIAEDAGARVVRRRFDNYAAQRNAALTDVEYKHPWIFMVDADERVTPELEAEIRSIVRNESNGATLYRVRRKDIFLSRWLKHSSGYPTWFGRLLKKGHVWVERRINEEYHTDGQVEHLEGHLIHYPFNKGMAHWFQKHNQYSSMEAEVLANDESGRFCISGLFGRDPVVRRKMLKQRAYSLPGRPFLVFCYLYLVRRGFLDGRAGLTYCQLRALYEYLIDVKAVELKRQNESLPI